MPRSRSRFSNGVPWTSSPTEQKAFYEEAKRDPEIREAVERATGVDFDTLTYQEFREAYNAYITAGFAKAEFAAVAKADQAVRAIGRDYSKDDEIVLLKEQIATQREQFQAEIARLTDRFGLAEVPVGPTKKEKRT